MRIILFDGICNLCSGVVLFIMKRDKKAVFRFAPIQSAAGQALLVRHGAGGGRDTVYYIRNGVCLQESAAVLFILKDLGGAWKCFYPLILVPACLRDAVYRFVARHRYRWFGKRSSCLVPKGSLHPHQREGSAAMQGKEDSAIRTPAPHTRRSKDDFLC